MKTFFVTGGAGFIGSCFVFGYMDKWGFYPDMRHATIKVKLSPKGIITKQIGLPTVYPTHFSYELPSYDKLLYINRSMKRRSYRICHFVFYTTTWR